MSYFFNICLEGRTAVVHFCANGVVLDVMCCWNDPVSVLELKDLELKLEEDLGQTRITSLKLKFISPLPMDEIGPVATMLQEKLPFVTSLTLQLSESDDQESDEAGATFLRQFSNIESLNVRNIAECPALFRAIGGLTHLKYLTLACETKIRTLTPQSCEALADSLERLGSIQRVELSCVAFLEPEKCLEPLFVILAANAASIQLCAPMEYQPDPCDEDAGEFCRYQVQDHLLEIGREGPTFEQMVKLKCRQYNLPFPLRYLVKKETNNDGQGKEVDNRTNETKTLAAWVEALTTVKNLDHLDVFYAIFRQLPKEAWLPSKYWDTCDPNERLPECNGRSPKKRKRFQS